MTVNLRRKQRPDDLDQKWRVHTVCWAGSHALHLRGDFVECGITTGLYAVALASYVAMESTDRRFWLLGTTGPEDRVANMRVVPVPAFDTLAMIQEVAYLHVTGIDPLAHFWPKLVVGAVAVLADYDFGNETMDAFARSQGVEILTLGTGQGLLVKP